jgi:histone-lysine N-methyltransferase SETMAR
MEDFEFRVLIKYFRMKGWTAIQIKDELDSIFGESAPCQATIFNWLKEFRMGRTNVLDEEAPSRPETATTLENVGKVHKLVLADRRIQVRQIAGTLGISIGSVETILHEHLGFKKISARWVPRLLSPDNKVDRLTASEAVWLC